MTGREMLLFLDQTRDPTVNLRRETELFERVDDGGFPECVRFWTNSECLVRGKAKTAKYGWYNEETARKLQVPVVERSTGGGVVYHDEGNLNWSFFLKTSGTFLSPTASFERASAHIIAALRSLGVSASFAPPNRLDVSGRKVSGMAARSTRRTLLVHGTLLLNSNLDRLNQLCIPPPGCPPVANLSEWQKGIEAAKVAKAVVTQLTDSGFQVRQSSWPG
jgi:lipoate-protein ligase A